MADLALSLVIDTKSISQIVSDLFFGIYGFEFTKPMTVAGIAATPLFTRVEVERRASDKRALRLTGYGRIPSTTIDGWRETESVELLAAGMTFAQQQHVTVSRLIELSDGDSIEGLCADARLGRPFQLLGDRGSFGSAIAPDYLFAGSRERFLNLFVSRFGRELPDDAFRQAFFRQLEISRLSTAFVELHHFLAFSGLELLARSEGPRATANAAAEPIVDLLVASGFPITQAEVEKWTHARNRAFHNGELVSSTKSGEVIRLSDQLFAITQVFCDVLLRKLGFDDGHIHWNRWRDHMPFC